MLSLCIRYVSDDMVAKEVLSDGFVKVFDNLKNFEFRNGMGLQSWIKRIMINESLSYLRKKNKYQENMPLEAVSNLLSSFTIETNDEEIIYQAIRQLPVGSRTIVNMYIIEGFSHKEISEQLGITENTSRSQLTHARKKLQAQLKGML